MGRFIDMTGKIFGRLTVINRGPDYVNGESIHVRWNCKCSCGVERLILRISLRHGLTKSCGCLRDDSATKHGRYKTGIYKAYTSAKNRCKKNGKEFSLKLEDLIVPEYCPILGIKLNKENHTMSPDSPSIDRIDNTKTYTRENCWIISNQANTFKNNSTCEQLIRLAIAVWNKLPEEDRVLSDELKSFIDKIYPRPPLRQILQPAGDWNSYINSWRHSN